MQELIKFASRLADEARIIAQQYYRSRFEIISKGDASPVTIADRAIEARMRDIITAERPEDGILGEEFDRVPSQNGLTWVLDPIDGTKSFIMGRPTFGTLIALCEGNKPVLGVIDQPILKERWIGAKGMETTFNGAPVKVRQCPSMDLAVAASTTPDMFRGDRDGLYKPFEARCKFAWGSDCYGYGLLASGHLDLMVEDCLKPYDFAALVPVVEGAGGMMCDYSGAPMTLDSKGDVVALGDKALWPQVRAVIEEYVA